MEKLDSERAVFVSPYLNRRLRSFEEVMKVRQRQELADQQVEDESQGATRGEGTRLRLVYSREEDGPAASVG